jgi:hypothetical protein
MTKIIASLILNRARAKSLIKRAVASPAASPAATIKAPNAVPPPSPAAKRWLFDKPGGGDAQARSQIFDSVKQTGRGIYNAASRVVGGKPPSAYAYGAGPASAQAQTSRPPATPPAAAGPYGPNNPAFPTLHAMSTGIRSVIHEPVGNFFSGLFSGAGDKPAGGTAPGGYRAPTLLPDSSVTSGTGAVGVNPASPQPAVSRPPVANPLLQPGPGQTVELLPDGTPDTSSLIDAPAQAAPPPSAASSAAAWGSGGAGPGGSPGQTPGQTQPAAQTQSAPPASDPQQPAPTTSGLPQIDTKPYEAVLGDPKATPEQKTAARTEYAEKWVAANKANVSPELVESINAWQQDPNSPGAELFNKNLGETGEVFMKQQLAQAINDRPEIAQNQDLFGQTIAGIQSTWDNLGTVGQMGLMVGVPLAMIGLLGGSGLGMILGGLGLGIAGAAGGLFGDGAKGLLNNAISGIGGMFGSPAAANSAAAAQTAAAAPGAEPLPPLAEADQLKLVQGLSAAPDGVQYLAQNKAQFGQLAGLPDDRLAPIAQQMTPESRATTLKMLQDVQQQIDAGITQTNKVGGPGWLADRLSGDSLNKYNLRSTTELPGLKAKIDRMLKILSTPQTQSEGSPALGKESALVNKNSKTVAQIFARRATINILRKAARCWSGYEPVPGAKPYTPGSCRPKGSKKTKKEVISGKKSPKKS